MKQLALALAFGMIGAVSCRAEAPPADLPQPVEMCQPSEPGRRLVFYGQVLDYAGKPIARAAVVAYNTDINGLYNPPNSPTRVPRIRGAAVTDERGFFAFKTVWPGAYPNGTDPAHIHLITVAPAHNPKNGTILFKGDPKLDPQRDRPTDSQFVVEPTKRQDDAFECRIDLKLSDN